MASAFWYLEDGRGFSVRWTGMSYMLNLITIELKETEGAEKFYNYLEPLVCRWDKGDEPNGFGGFIRNGEIVMLNFDLRTFSPANRNYFWDATQKALVKLKIEQTHETEWIENLFILLLDMHKRIKLGEDPMILNHMREVIPDPKERLGPGW